MTLQDAAGYPRGSRVTPDADTRLIGRDMLWGGSPARVMRLSEPGQRAWTELTDGQVRTAAAARLARRLTDAGLLQPVLGPGPDLDVTVVVPARDRAVELDRCLTALGRAHPVLVVDDASLDPSGVAAVCARHGARVLRRQLNGGPAAARNTALAQLDSEFALLLDSDCVPPRDLVAQLAGAFADPLVGAVAPRIQALPGSSMASRYGAMASSLDLGARPARVTPRSRVSYVPTAALLIRRTALEEVGGFDADLRVGEDVDLVWRLDARGWRVRYEPSVVVQHDEPTAWGALLSRRYRYGTSAGPLDRRHPGLLAPLFVHSWSAIAVGAALARRPPLAVAALCASTAGLRRTLREAGIGSSGAGRESVAAALRTWCAVGRAATQFAAPLLAIGVIASRRHRLMVSVLALSGPVNDWLRGPRTMGLTSYAAARIADDSAYGAGVIAGSLRHRTTGPLRAVLVHRLLRVPPPVLRPVMSTTGQAATVSEKSTVHV